MKRKKTSILDRKMFGLTVVQLGMLAGLAIMAVCSLGVVGLLIMTSDPVPLSPQGGNGGALLPTEPVLPTVVPTITPTLPPSPTSPPTPFVPPQDWIKFESEGASVWLPGNYIGGDMLAQREETIKNITTQVKMSELGIKMLKESPDYRILAAVQNKPGIIALTTVYIEKHDGQKDLIKYLSENVETEETTVFARKKLTISGYEARRVDYEYKMGAQVSNGIEVAIQGKNTIWVIQILFSPEQQIEVGQYTETVLRTITLP